MGCGPRSGAIFPRSYSANAASSSALPMMIMSFSTPFSEGLMSPSSHRSDAERRRPLMDAPRGRARLCRGSCDSISGEPLPSSSPCPKMLSRLLARPAGAARALFSSESAASATFGFELSDDTKSYQQLARKFAKEEIIPAAAEYDRSMVYPSPLFKKAWEVSSCTDMWGA